MTWLIPRAELTPDQIRAIELSPSEHRMITGGPGSGKTQVLLHRAKHLAEQHGVGPDRFRIFVYTNILKEYIKSALSVLGLPEESVLTYDSWCCLFYEQNIGRHLPWDAKNKTRDFEAIRRAVLQKVSAGTTPPIYDFVLVDEAQDLQPEAFSLFACIARHVTVCFDNKQQIYDSGSTEGEILSRLGAQRRNINLIDAFRVCPYLVELAAPLIATPAEREAFRHQKRTIQTERQTPLLFYAANFEDEKRMLYEMVRERQLMNDRIAILLPQLRQVYGFAHGLTDAGIEVEVPRQHGGRDALPAHDFSSSRPKLMSYHSAKGLTFDSVLLPRLVPSSFRHVTEERLEKLIFVALTRATKWAYLSSSAQEALPPLQKLLPLEATRQLTVRRGAAYEIPPANTQAVAEGPLDFL